MADSAGYVAGNHDPGWYPDHLNPNVQQYWDGDDWTAQRRWTGGHWQPEPVARAIALRSSAGGSSTSGATSHSTARGSAPRSAPPASPWFGSGRQRGATTSATASRPTMVTGSHVGLLLSSILLILGSFSPWITASLFSFNGSASGTDSVISAAIGVNGWITFSGGILLFVLLCMAVISSDAFFRSAALIIAVVVTGFAVYDLVGILQKISQSTSQTFNNVPVAPMHVNVGVGWGLIVVVIGAVGALLCAWGQARSG